MGQGGMLGRNQQGGLGHGHGERFTVEAVESGGGLQHWEALKHWL